MAVFCDMCGAQFGFFSSKKKLKVDETTKTVCKKCYKENKPEEKKSEAPKMAPPPGALLFDKKRTKTVVKLPSYDKIKYPFLEFDEFPFGVDGLKPFSESLKGEGRETRFIKAVCTDMLIYGVTEEGLKEGLKHMKDSMKKWKTDEEKAHALIHMATYTAYIIEYIDKAVDIMKTASKLDLNDKLKIEVLKIRLMCELMGNKFNVAIDSLKDISKLIKNIEIKSKVLFTIASLYIYKINFNKLGLHFLNQIKEINPDYEGIDEAIAKFS
jgi:hypothetical protein